MPYPTGPVGTPPEADGNKLVIVDLDPLAPPPAAKGLLPTDWISLKEGGRYVPEKVIEHAELLWREREARLRILRVPPVDIDRSREKFLRDVALYQAVLRDGGDGKSNAVIAASHSLKPAVVNRWRRGHGIPRALGQACAPRRLRPYTVPEGECRELAAVIGVYFAVKLGSGGGFGPLTKDRVLADALASDVKGAFGITARVHSYTKHGSRYFQVQVRNSGVLLYLSRITRGVRQMPWEHLVTLDERRACLRAFLDWRRFSQDSTRKGTGKSKKNVPNELMIGRADTAREISHLFASCGIYPNYYVLQGKHRFGLRASTTVSHVGNLKLLSSDKRSAFARLGDKQAASRKGKDVSCALYDQVQELKASGRLSAETIGAQVGLSGHTIRAWKTDSRLPREVQNRAEYLRRYSDRPAIDTIGFLFRELKVPLAVALALAPLRTRAQFAAVAEVLRERGIDIRRNPEALLCPPEEILEPETALPIEPTGSPLPPRDEGRRSTPGTYLPSPWREILREHPPLPADQQRELYMRARGGDGQARTALLYSCLGIASRFRRRFQTLGMEVDDIFSEAFAGVSRAFDKFDPSRKNRYTGEPIAFSSVAFVYIRATLQQAVIRARPHVIPPGMLQDLTRVTKAKRELRKELGTKPTNQQIAERLDWTVDRLADLYRFKRGARPQSLSRPVGDSESPLVDMVPGKESVKPNDSTVEVFRGILGELRVRERNQNVFMQWCGLATPGQDRMSYSAVGRALGLSKNRVQQIVARVVWKLRSSSNPRVKAFLDGLPG